MWLLFLTAIFFISHPLSPLFTLCQVRDGANEGGLWIFLSGPRQHTDPVQQTPQAMKKEIDNKSISVII